MIAGRYSFVDKACGIAMLFVVYGHLIFPETINIPWWQTSRDFIYKFHMPLFMFVSGFIVFLSTAKKNITNSQEYISFQRKKVRKFFPAYLFFSLLAIVVDVFMNNATSEEVWKSVFSFFFSPDRGSAGFLWYLYVLTGFYLITPFLLKLSRIEQSLLLFLGFLLTNTSFSILFSADLFAKYFFFFLAGGMFFLNLEKSNLFLKKNGLWISILTVALVIIDLNIGMTIPYQLISLGLIFSILYISSFKWPSALDNMVITMGLGSFAIYLFNTSILNAYYFVYKSVFHLPVSTFFIFSNLVFTVAFSVLLRYIFNRIVPQKIYSL